MRLGFTQCHPMVNFLFFTTVIADMLLFTHPVYLCICFVCGAIYSTKLLGIKGLLFSGALLPLVILWALYYSSYTHFGVTVLQQNLIGNQITLESFLYGLVLGLQVAGCCLWFSCIHAVFTTDKVVYLFGVLSPVLSLFLSAILRMVPRIKVQAKRISAAQKGIGRGIDQGTVFRRFRNLLRIGSALITWFLESCVTLSESMQSRGMKAWGRTAFSVYSFDNWDRIFVLAMVGGFTLSGMGALLGQTRMQYDPRLIFPVITPMSWVFFCAFAALCLLPFALDVLTDLSFRKAGGSR